MESDEDLFGFGSMEVTQESTGKSAAANGNPDDLFSSLATRHALSQEPSAMEFDPFGDNLWKTPSEQDPFDLSSMTTPTTRTTTNSTLTSVINTTSSTCSPSLNDDFSDLLNFDTSVTTTTPTLAETRTSESVDTEKQSASASNLFFDLDPLSPTVDIEQPMNLKPTLCVTEDDPFEVKPVEKLPDNKRPQENSDTKNNEINIFESMKVDSMDPFSIDPFSRLTTKDTPLDTSEPPATNQTTTGGDDWLESLTCSEVTAPPGKTGERTNELDSGNKPCDQGDGLDTDVTMTEDTTPVNSLLTDKQAGKMEDAESEDLSVIKDTAQLDVQALKQKSSLRKKGSLALRRKPSRKGVRDSLLAVVDQFQEIDSQDSSSKTVRPTAMNEAPEEGSSSVSEKHDVEKPEIENKPPPVERPSVLRRGASKAPPGGQMAIPGLADIGKVKLRKSGMSPVGTARPASIATGLTQPVSIPKVQLRSSQRSSLILPKPATTTTTSSPSNRVNYQSLFTKPKLQTKPQIASLKPKLAETKDTSSLKKDRKPYQPSWQRDAKEAKMASEELSAKHQQEKEPEKPAWIKASIEKKDKSVDSVTTEIETKSNKENNLPSTSRSEKVNKDSEKIDMDQSSENRLNKLNYLQTKKSATQSSPEANQKDLLIENTVTKTFSSRLSSPGSSSNNGRTTEGITTDEQEEVTRRVKLSPRPDYIPSRSSHGYKVLPGVETEENNLSTGELPKWKRDLLEKRKQKPTVIIQTDSPAKDSPSSETSEPPWKKELQNRRRSSIKQKEPVGDSKSSNEPEWLRKAEERRARLSKSGMFEQGSEW